MALSIVLRAAKTWEILFSYRWIVASCAFSFQVPTVTSKFDVNPRIVLSACPLSCTSSTIPGVFKIKWWYLLSEFMVVSLNNSSIVV